MDMVQNQLLFAIWYILPQTFYLSVQILMHYSAIKIPTMEQKTSSIHGMYTAFSKQSANSPVMQSVLFDRCKNYSCATFYL